MGMAASQARLLSITSRMSDIEFRSQQISNTKIRLADESQEVADAYTKALNASKYTYTDYSSGQAQVISMTANNLGSSGYRLVRSDGTPIVSKSQLESYKIAIGSYNSSSGYNANATDEDHYVNSRNVYALHQLLGTGAFANVKVGTSADGKDKMATGGWQDILDAGLVTQAQIDQCFADYETMFNASSGGTYSQGGKQADGANALDESVVNDPNWLYEAIQSGQFKIEQNTSKGWVEVSASSSTQIAIQSDSTNLAQAEAQYNADSNKINTKEKKLDMQLKELDTEHSALKNEQDSVKSLISDNVTKSFNLFS